MKARPSLSFAVALPLLFLCACNHTGITEADLEKLRGYDTRIGKLQTTLEEKTTKLIDTGDKLIEQAGQQLKLKDETSQFAAQHVFAAHQAVTEESVLTPRTVFISAELARAIESLPRVDQTMKDKAIERLRLALSSSEADKATLREKYLVLDAEKKQLEARTRDLQASVDGLRTDKSNLEKDRDGIKTEIVTVQKEAIEKGRELFIKSQEQLREERDTGARKAVLARWLIFAGIGAGLLAALSVQFYPPVTLPLGAAAVGFMVAAWAVVSVPTWVLILILVATAAAVALAFYIRYDRTRKVADNTIGAIEQLKNAARDGDASAKSAYSRLRPELEDWFGASEENALHTEMHGRLKKLNVIGKVSKSL